jgi:hypothetical protein
MVVAMKISRLSPKTLTEAKNARRLFLMVAELHKLGYEGLRATPYPPPPAAIGVVTLSRPA